jgi:catalase (peroxidase I)
LWQDRCLLSPRTIDAKDIASLKSKILASDCRLSAGLDRMGVRVVFRGTDKRGGANGARASHLRRRRTAVKSCGAREVLKTWRAFSGFNDAQAGGRRRSRWPT